MKFITGGLVVIIALSALHWLDAFHIAATLLILVPGTLVCVWWKRRKESVDAEKETEALEDSAPTLSDRIRSLVLGAMGGVLLTGMIAAVSAAMAATPIGGLFYGCDELLNRIEMLKAGNAYAYALRLTEERLNVRTSGACRARLSEQRVRLLVALGERSPAGERQSLLRRALTHAQELRNEDLTGLIRSKLEVLAKQVQIDQLHKSQLIVIPGIKRPQFLR